MLSSLTVAQRLLKLADDRQVSMTPMKLLKLVYMCHGWMLALYSRPLIRDEIQAWKYGPVIPVLYEEIKRFRSSHISEIRRNPAEKERIDQYEDDVIKQVFENWGGRDGLELSYMTHRPGTPWHSTYRPGFQGIVISNDIIQAYYGQLLHARTPPDGVRRPISGSRAA